MNVCLNRQQKDDFMKRGFSRRDLGRVAAMIAAGAALAVLERTGDGATLGHPRAHARRRGEDQRQ